MLYFSKFKEHKLEINYFNHQVIYDLRLQVTSLLITEHVLRKEREWGLTCSLDGSDKYTWNFYLKYLESGCLKIRT
jgi:hypothetical protein